MIVVTASVGVAQQDNGQRPLLRVRLEPQATVMVGQPVKLTVEILVPTWFTRAPEFPQLEIPGALAILPDERPVNLSERIDGATWSGMSRSYLIYPQEPHVYTLPPAEVVLTYALKGAKPSPPTKLALPPRNFEARIPAEAAGLDYFIATTELRLEQKFDRRLADLKVGDSIGRTITITAAKTFAMFLPALQFEPTKGLAGLAIYPQPPQVVDERVGRGEFKAGRRVESVTYYIQQEGYYQLPEISISWWDLETSKMRTSMLATLEFHADPNPDYRSELPPELQVETEEEVAEIGKSPLDVVKEWAIPVLVALALLVWGLKFRRRFVARIHVWREQARNRNANSEAAFFERFRQACMDNDPVAALRHLMFWLDRVQSENDAATIERFVNDSEDEELRLQVEYLENLLFAEKSGQQQKDWSGRNLYSKAARARRQMRKGKKRSEARIKNSLPLLNPSARRGNL
ncbi:MAG: hypothetical protein O7E52_29425 [Candidatus Poribacteria bacterium]|nr:hypothetical protein [Candidatus Poribacteria bacterium]